MPSDCPVAFFPVAIEHMSAHACAITDLGRWRQWLRNATELPPNRQRRRVMLSNEHNEQMSFVCYRVLDMPTPRVSSVEGYALVATRRFGCR